MSFDYDEAMRSAAIAAVESSNLVRTVQEIVRRECLHRDELIAHLRADVERYRLIAHGLAAGLCRLRFSATDDTPEFTIRLRTEPEQSFMWSLEYCEDGNCRAIDSGQLGDGIPDPSPDQLAILRAAYPAVDENQKEKTND